MRVDLKHLELLNDIDNLYLWWNIGVPYEICKSNEFLQKVEEIKKSKDKSKKGELINNFLSESPRKYKDVKVITEFLNKKLDYLEKNFDGLEPEFEKFLRTYNNKILDKRQNIAKQLSLMNKDLIDFYEKKYGENDFTYKKFSLTTKERLVIGTGNPHIFEVGFSLHPLYGVPYIPGSELKGLVRYYYKTEKGLENEAEEVTKIFGDQNKKGSVEFLDAYLSENKDNIFELDIMNPHYGDYYTKKEPPADYLKPVPIFFLAIKPGTQFETLIYGIGKKANENVKDVLDIMKKWFNKIGIGAKTAVGYGRMDVNDEI